MAQVFSRSANAIAKGSIVGAVALIAAVSLGAVALDHSDYNTGAFLEKAQPVQFSHRRHRGDDGISCRYCHTSVEVSDSAGLPPTQTCMNCHSQIWADSPYLEPVFVNASADTRPADSTPGSDATRCRPPSTRSGTPLTPRSAMPARPSTTPSPSDSRRKARRTR
jgi:hypothetical protein